MIELYDAGFVVVFTIGLMTILHFVIIKPIIWFVEYNNRIWALLHARYDDINELRTRVYVLERKKK